MLILGGLTAVAQERTFWVLDQGAGELSHEAPGQPGSSGIVLPGALRQVRATPAGLGVVTAAGGPTIHLLGTDNVLAATVMGAVQDAAPDGLGGAWVLSRAGPISLLSHVSRFGVETVRSTIAGAAVIVQPVRDGCLLVASRVQSISWLTLFDPTGTLVLDTTAVPRVPSALVLTNDGRVALPGVAVDVIPLIVTTLGTISVEQLVPANRPVVGVAPLGGTDLLVVVDGVPPALRYVDLDGGTVWSFAVPGPSAVEGLPSGDVLVHQWETETAWRVDRHGFATWQGPWATTSGRPDGAGMQFARATPDADPDGDGFTNDEEINCGSDPGDARSAPFAVWRSGSVLHLAAADPAAVSYVVVASTDVVAGTSPLLCAATPLLHASLTPGVCFTAPYGALVGGRADLLLLPGLPADPWIAAAVYRSGWTPLHTLSARPRSQW